MCATRSACGKRANQDGDDETLGNRQSGRPPRELDRCRSAPVQALRWGGLPDIILPVPLMNMICTNVSGSAVPLYAVGRRMIATYPQVPTGYDLGVGCAVQSYDGKFLSDRARSWRAGAHAASFACAYTSVGVLAGGISGVARPATVSFCFGVSAGRPAVWGFAAFLPRAFFDFADLHSSSNETRTKSRNRLTERAECIAAKAIYPGHLEKHR
jgi:hypothetical protein